MSITLGIYDNFSYMIPGLLYLYAFNELFHFLGWVYIDIPHWFQSGQTPSLIFLIPLLIVSFIIGHVFDIVAHKFYDIVSKVRPVQSAAEKSLISIRDRYPSLKVQFESKDRSTLFVLLRLRNLELSKFIDKFNADAIMLRNIAFGLLLLTVDYILAFFLSGLWNFMFAAILILLLSLLSRSRSNDFRLRFFKHIYRASLEYGLNIKEVVEYDRKKSKPARNIN